MEDEADICEASEDRAGGEKIDVATGPSWSVSLCFWLTLLCSALIYGAVALAPKFAVWNTVRHEYRRNAGQLAELEEDVEYLERVTDALQSDPDFLRHLASASGVPTEDDGAEMIPVSGHLLFGYEHPTSDAAVESDKPPLDGIARTLATHTRLRTTLLTTAALLTIFAFTFLNDAGEKLVRTAGRVVRTIAALPLRRYLADSSRDDSPDARSADCKAET